jgi:nitrile hydratase accessory protein
MPAELAPILRDPDGPVFPTPWAARAFALAVALNKGGLFTWSEWSESLGEEMKRRQDTAGTDPEAYWRAWLAALEIMLDRKRVAGRHDLLALQAAWRRAAESTPHGMPVELSAG